MIPRRSILSRSAGRNTLGAQRALLASGLAAASIWACSSSVDLEPLEQMGAGDLNPIASAGAGGTSIVSPYNPGNEITPPPALVPSGAAGASGSSGNGDVSGTGAGGSTPMGSAGAGNVAGAGGADMMGAAGAPPCADPDGDGRCSDVDRCPDVRDDGADGDGDGLPDACDPCPELQDDGSDVDGDGIGDACDRCGIHVALDLAPMYYLSLDEAPGATTAVNRGSVPLNAQYIGPLQQGLAGVSDPNGKAIRLSGGANGEFSRVSFVGINTFPSTALTTTFWLRTINTGDYGMVSYAVQSSSNEFGIVVDGGRVRLTLNTSTFIAENLDPLELADGAWHFVALTWQETVAQFYIDGEAAGDVLRTEPGFEIIERAGQELTGLPRLSPFGGVLVLGQDQDSLNGGFNVAQALVGGLDEFALYDRALTVDEIRSIYTGTTCGEICDGTDNDGDGKTDEGFLGSAAACAAPSCAAISDAFSAFGSGEYASSVNPDVPLICNF